MTARWVVLVVLCCGSAAWSQSVQTNYAGSGQGTGLPAGPTSPNGVPQSLTSTPSGGVAGAAAWNLQGVAPNAQTGTSYTVLVTDRLGYLTFSNASPVAVTLPQAGSTGFGSNFTFKACNVGAGAVTITPTTSTISYTGLSGYISGAASMSLSTNQCAFIQSDNTNYFAHADSPAPPAGLLSCAVLDSAICTSSVDASGNPNFLGTAANTVLPINGGTTSLVMFIGGVYQVLNTNVTLTLPSTTGQYWIIAKQDTTNANMVAADFVASATPPVYDKVAPVCPSSPQGIAVSSTNPAFWFDLSTNLAKLCTSNGGSYSASPSMSIGLADVTGCASCSIDASVAEPYRLSPYKRYQLFGYGSGGVMPAVSSSVTIGTVGTITLGAGGSGYASGGTLTIQPCGAQATYTQSGGVIQTVTLSPTIEGNSCIAGNGFATTVSPASGTGATINITNLNADWNFPLNVAVVSGGVLTASAQFPTQAGNSNRNLGVIIITPNPFLVLGTGKITSTAMSKIIAGTVNAGASTNENGGLGGIGGGGGGGTNAGGQSGGGMKWSTPNAPDSALGGGANTAGANALFGPVEASPELVPSSVSIYCGFRQGMGAAGGPGGGDGTNKGGDGGSAAGYLCIAAPSGFVAGTASINCNGAVGGNSAAAGNTGGGGGGGGGICEILTGFVSGISRGTSTNFTAAGGSGGTGFGTGGAGGTGTPGMVMIHDGIQY